MGRFHWICFSATDRRNVQRNEYGYIKLIRSLFHNIDHELGCILLNKGQCLNKLVWNSISSAFIDMTMVKTSRLSSYKLHSFMPLLNRKDGDLDEGVCVCVCFAQFREPCGLDHVQEYRSILS